MEIIVLFSFTEVNITFIKETYLSERGLNNREVMNISDIPKAHRELNAFKLSSQAQKDFMELLLNLMKNNAINSVVLNVSGFCKWK